MNGAAGLVSSSLEALNKRYRAVTHNLANASTAGFKKRRSMFAHALEQKEREYFGGDQPSATSGKISETSVIDFTQGSMLRTGRTLDVAISGSGFFVLETPGGETPQLYTRNGTFQVDSSRRIVDSSGRMLMGTGGPITLPEGSSPAQLQIAADGSISLAGQPLAKINVVDFKDKAKIMPVGQNCFSVPKDAESQPPESFALQQGYREESNVSVVEELVDLVTVTRLYEANLKSMGTQEDRMKSILQVAMG